MTKTNKIAVIGGGMLAQSAHIPAIKSHPHSRVIGVVDIDDHNRKKIESEYGFRTFSNSENLFEELTPDAVHIVTPPLSRSEYIKTA